MKILALSNLYPPDVMGGYELACAQAVDALRARGHAVDVLTASPRRPVPTPDPPHVHRRLSLTEDRYWVASPGAAEDALLLLRDVGSRLVSSHNVYALTVALREFRPDVVYVANVVGLGGLALLATLQHLGVPWLWQLADRVPFDVCFAGGRLIPALAEAFSRGLSGHFVAVSRRIVAAMEADGVRLNGPLDLAPLWISGPRPPERTGGGRRTGSPLRIMSCGRVSREKGVGLLVEAAALLCDAGRDGFRIDVFGEVTDPSLAPMIRGQGLSDRVTLRGPRPHRAILDLYADYDLLAFPARDDEPFGMVALEALSRGCVPVMARGCGVAEWLVHGVHCLKVARDARAFADVLARVLDGEVALGPIARRGEAAVWRDFHVDAVAPRIERALVRAARSARPAPGSPDEAYRLARLAEGVARGLVQDALVA